MFILVASLVMGFIISIFTQKLEPLVEGKPKIQKQQRTENFQVKIGNSKFQIKIENVMKKQESKIISSLLKSYWFVYGALLRQSSIFEPKSGKKPTGSECRCQSVKLV